MRSKKFFCNMTVLKHDIVRFWPLWGILFAGLQMMHTLPFFFFVLSRMEEDNGKVVQRVLLQEGVQRMYEAASPYLICVVAVLTAVLVFGYLFKKRENYLLHSFPVKREEYFCSHFLSGFLMLIVPYIITYVMLWGICGMCAGNYAGVMLGTMFGTLLEVIVMILFFYTLACVVVMLSGSPAITVIIYIVLNVLVAGLALLVSSACEAVLNYTVTIGDNSQISSVYTQIIEHSTPLLHFVETLSGQMTGYGFRGLYFWSILGVYIGDGGEYVRDWYNTSEEEFLTVIQIPWQQVGKIMWYLIPAVLFLLLACYLYRKRRLERMGESLAFPWGNIVFHGVFTICGSYVFANVMYQLSIDALKRYFTTYRSLFLVNIGYLLLGCIICFIISNMILQKTFRIWKGLSLVQLGVYSVCVLGMMLLVRYQCYHGSLPDAKEVDRLEIQMVNIRGDESGSIIVERRDDIGVILMAVQEVYDNAEDMPLKEDYYTDEEYNLYFNMADKGNVELNVNCLGMKYFKEQYDMVSDIINNPAAMMEKILTEDYKNLGKDEYTIYWMDEEGETHNLDELRRYKRELLLALEKDLATGEFTFEEIIDSMDSGGSDRLYISVYPYKKEGGKESDARHKSKYGDMGIRITAKFKNFWKVYDDLVLRSMDK